MRLQKSEAAAIKNSFLKYFHKGSIYLFGSRVNDNGKGGDIDLYLQPDDQDRIMEKKIKFLIDVKNQIGDQKIDVIIARDKHRAIESEAMNTGVLL